MAESLWAQYGLAGLVAGATLGLVWKVVDRGWAAVERRLGTDGAAHGTAAGGLSPIACQVDPEHFLRLREVHRMVSEWDSQIHAGEFSCAWRDRDEIRDLLEALRGQSTRQEDHLSATRELTKEVRALARELRTTRNGRDDRGGGRG